MSPNVSTRAVERYGHAAWRFLMVIGTLPFRISIVALQLALHAFSAAYLDREFSGTAIAVAGLGPWAVKLHRLANRCKHSSFLAPRKLLATKRPQKPRKGNMVQMQLQGGGNEAVLPNGGIRCPGCSLCSWHPSVGVQYSIVISWEEFKKLHDAHSSTSPAQIDSQQHQRVDGLDSDRAISTGAAGAVLEETGLGPAPAAETPRPRHGGSGLRPPAAGKKGKPEEERAAARESRGR